MKVLVAGFSYAKKNYFDTFRSYPKDQIHFLLPKVWKAKKGKVVFNSPEGGNITRTKAFFYHSKYPLIGGLLKGWMPLFPFNLKKDIDLVYSPSEPILLTTLYQGFWTKILRKKHIIFTWDNIAIEDKFNGFNKFIKKLILKLNLFFCDGVVCGNRKARDILQRETKKPLTVIPLSGVNTEFFNPSADINIDSDLKILRGKLIYSFAGAIGYRKGIHLIIRALGGVVKQIPNTHFLLVGSGDYEEEINNIINDLGLAKYITKMPWASPEKMREVLAISDIFLYPSFSHKGWEEQFGYSMAEASLMKVPVISTSSGSIEEVVINGKTGILVKENNAEELKTAMIILGKDKELRNKLGESGREYISNNFSHEIISDKFRNFFKKVLNINNA